MSDERARLVAAGRRLALRVTLDQLDPLQLCAEAKLGLDGFERSFGSLQDFLLAMQQDFMDRLRDKIFAVTTGLSSPLMRLKLATETYLSGCLAERDLRNWLVEGRTQQPELIGGLRKQNQVYWIFLGAEFRALGWPHPQAAARLFLAMANEASQAEHRVGQALPSVRETLFDFLERGKGS